MYEQRMESWELVAKCMGKHYTIFVVFLVNTLHFMGCLTASWTSPVLVKLKGTEDNPLGRPITSEESDLIGSLFYLGAALGPLLFINSVEKLGAKRVLVALSSILPISYITLAFAERVELYYACRIILGIFVGAVLSIQPGYVSEITSPEKRCFIMSFITLFSINGLLTSYVLGPLLHLFNFNVLIAMLSILFTVMIVVCCPESPFYVMRTEGKKSTRSILEKLRTSDVEKELNEIQDTIVSEVRKSYMEIFQSKENMKSLVMATVPLLLQQFSGITVLITYSQIIFQESKIDIPSHHCSIIVTLVQLLTSFSCPALLKSKKFSRKSLLMFTLFTVSLCNSTMGFYFTFGRNISFLNWLPLLTTICYVIFYNCGLDPIPWMLVSEIYPMNIKSMGAALSACIFSLATFPILYSFHKVQIGSLFLCSAVCCLLGVFYVKFFVAETEGKSLREIHTMLHDKNAA